MRDRRELFTHLLMAAAPFLMLLAVTAAWFINSHTSDVAQMSFASQDAGPGAALHFGTVDPDPDKRIYVPEAAPPTLQNTVYWGKEEKTEDSAIVLEHMLPGQCEYYLLVSDHPLTVTLSQVSFTDAGGVQVEDGAAVPLAQCLGFYLIPVPQADLDAFDFEHENGAVSTPKLSLDRDAPAAPAKVGRLSNAVLAGAVPTDPLVPEGWVEGGEREQAYILALYCDPYYLQEKPGAHVNELPGSVSFSLTFPKEEAAHE